MQARCQQPNLCCRHTNCFSMHFVSLCMHICSLLQMCNDGSDICSSSSHSSSHTDPNFVLDSVPADACGAADVCIMTLQMAKEDLHSFAFVVVEMVKDACKETMSLLEVRMNDTMGRTSKLVSALSRSMGPRRGDSELHHGHVLLLKHPPALAVCLSTLYSKQ